MWLAKKVLVRTVGGKVNLSWIPCGREAGINPGMDSSRILRGRD